MSLPLLPPGLSMDLTPDGAGVPARPLWGDLSVQVSRPDGPPIRWGGDELDARNVPCDMAFGTAMPGGFREFSCTLLRSMDLPPGEESAFDDFEVIGPGGETVYHGRLQQMPVSSDGGGRVTPQVVGWSSHMEDDSTLQLLGTDRDLTRWGPISAARRQAIINAGFAPDDGQVRWDAEGTSAPGPVLDLRREKGTAPWGSNPARPHPAITYHADGALISGIEFRARRPMALAGWVLQVASFSDLACESNLGVFAVPGVDITDGLLIGTAVPAGTRALEIALIYPTAPGGSADVEYGLMLAEVGVYGYLGGGVPTPSYVGTTTGPLGYRASDVLPSVLARAAPLLRYTTGPGGSIAETDFVIRHLALLEHGGAAAAVEHLNRYHGWDWGVWENREFWWQPRSSGRTWIAASADGLTLSLEGDNAANIWNGVVVAYTDYAGDTHTVGPPGSGTNREDPRLISLDENNPATRHGIRRWRYETMSVAADYESACTFGQMVLGQAASATRRGSAAVAGTIYDEAGNPHPTWQVRAGDTLIVSDRPDDPPRRIVETGYNHPTQTTQLTLDNASTSVDAIVERIANSLVGAL